MASARVWTLILNMAAQAETTVKRFHSPDRDMALQSEERFRRAETLPRNNNLALQAFTLFEWFLGDAIQSLDARVLLCLRVLHYSMIRASLLYARITVF